MKFAFKMIALISVLLALSLSFSGFLVVQSACRSELDNTVSAAQEDMKLFGTTLQALCLVENSIEEPEESVKHILQNYSVFDMYHYYVYDQNGRPLAGSGEARPQAGWPRTLRPRVRTERERSLGLDDVGAGR